MTEVRLVQMQYALAVAPVSVCSRAVSYRVWRNRRRW